MRRQLSSTPIARKWKNYLKILCTHLRGAGNPITHRRPNGPCDRRSRCGPDLLFRCTHDVRPRAFAPCQRLQYRIQNDIEILADLLCKKAQNEIAVVLQQPVFPAIASVGFWIGEMLRAIEFQDDTQRLVEEIDLHLTL